jgi:acyl-homoserine lactone acylase PvdQ
MKYGAENLVQSLAKDSAKQEELLEAYSDGINRDIESVNPHAGIP